jgi:ATP-dependent DNA ligase
VISLDNNFNKLQSRASTKDVYKLANLEKQTPILYMTFDCLQIGDKNLTLLPLKERLITLNEMFKTVLPVPKVIKITDYKPIQEWLDYAKKTNRTYNSVYAAILRHTPRQQQVTKVKKSSTVVFNNYKSVIVEANSILIEF